MTKRQAGAELCQAQEKLGLTRNCIRLQLTPKNVLNKLRSSSKTKKGGGGIFFDPPSQTCAPKISASVNGGLSEGSSVRRPRSEGPHRRKWKYFFLSTGGTSTGAPVFCPRKFFEIERNPIEFPKLKMNLFLSTGGTSTGAPVFCLPVLGEKNKNMFGDYY